MSRASLFVPLVAFVVLVGLLYAGFSLEDPHRLPSALVGRAFPAFALADLNAPDTVVTQSIFEGQVTLVNVWATWCPTCKAEHAELARIHDEEGMRIIGINYKDDPAAARRWLARYGDPYELHVIDADGLLGVDLGVYGAPESFLVDQHGVIVHKRVGDVNRRVWEAEFVPLVAQLRDALASKAR